jgi:hypothetical protein
MIMFQRIFVSGCAALLAFVLAFLAIFVPLLLWDTHTDPHDGQGGMGGFFLGIPVALLAALATLVGVFVRATNRRWFESSKQGGPNDHGRMTIVEESSYEDDGSGKIQS